jgi:hypothetical protein
MTWLSRQILPKHWTVYEAKTGVDGGLVNRVLPYTVGDVM